jgi:hypothetical protein
MVGPARKREAVGHLQRELEMSQRRACNVVGQPRATQRHPPSPTRRKRACANGSTSSAGNDPVPGIGRRAASCVRKGSG